MQYDKLQIDSTSVVSSVWWSCAWRAILLFNVRSIQCQIFDAGGAGSMFETGRRWRVPYLIYLLALIMLAEIAFNGEACLRQSTLEASLSISAVAPLILPPWQMGMPSSEGSQCLKGLHHPAGYATWFVEQRRPDCAPTRKLWNPQDVGRVSLSSRLCA